MPPTDQHRSYANSERLHAAASEVLAGGTNSNFRQWGQPVPLVFERASGSRLYDVDGNSYVDYALGMGPNILGHAPEPVLRAVADSLGQGQLFAGQHVAEATLARRVCEIVPCAELVRFGVAGSEMDQLALRLARAYTRRSKVVKFEGHYHGWFDTVLVSVAPPLDKAGPEHAPTPYLPTAGQSALAAADIAVLPWNNLDAVRAYLEAHAHETAALLMEPILCNTSVILPRPGYLEGVRKLCDQYDVLLIFDEVITGFRVALGGAQAKLGVTPDLAVFAKSLAGGFPIGAVAGKRAIMALLGDGSVLHGGSFNGHTASVAAALATLEQLARDGIFTGMEEQGETLMEGLRQVAQKAAIPFLVQGVGTVFNTAFTDQPAVYDYRSYVPADAEKLKRFLHALQDNGIRPTSRGTWFLSTAHTNADIEETISAAERALATL
ncbi:MAG TPA: aspartate aminotransferase family protein [Chloroflexota bacterium]|jgi:glutamate-1-semialdehyde 2,1-aminomutase